MPIFKDGPQKLSSSYKWFGGVFRYGVRPILAKKVRLSCIVWLDPEVWTPIRLSSLSEDQVDVFLYCLCATKADTRVVTAIATASTATDEGGAHPVLAIRRGPQARGRGGVAGPRVGFTPACLQSLIPPDSKCRLDINARRWRANVYDELIASVGFGGRSGRTRREALDENLSSMWVHHGSDRPAHPCVDDIEPSEWGGALDDDV